MILFCVGQLVIFALSAAAMHQKNQCVLRDGQCTYHVYLDNACGPGGRDKHNAVQNDKVQQMNQIEKNLGDVKSDHASRLEALENKILSMEKDAKGRTRMKVEKSAPSAVVTTTTTASPKLLTVPKNSASAPQTRSSLAAQDEKHLLDVLHAQFTDLRTRLRSLRNQLRYKDSRLNETSVKLNQTQDELFEITKKLLNTEGKLFDAETENADLRSTLENREKELNKTQESLDETTKKLRKAELERTITLSNLAKTRKELALQKRSLKIARKQLQRALIKYHDLNVENDKANRALKDTEQELVECYRGKTSQFCGFEDTSICGFSQDNDTDYFNWTRGSGETPSSRTGPRHDHTCGNNKGFYMYIEASGRGSNQNARLISPKYRSFTEQCIEFYYHMYGAHIGTLNVYTQIPEQDVAPLWRAFGDQGDLWSMARLPIPKEEAAKSYQVVFEAILEPGYAGDIAIDDFRVFDGECYHIKTVEDYVREGKYSMKTNVLTTPGTPGRDVPNAIGRG